MSVLETEYCAKKLQGDTLEKCILTASLAWISFSYRRHLFISISGDDVYMEGQEQS